MARVAKGTITFFYNLDEDPYFEMFEEEASDAERLRYFQETMVEDLTQMSYSKDLFNVIEMTIEESN